MNNRDKDIFEIYRPFRNKLAKFNVLDSLYLIWGYSRNYTFDQEFPRDIERPFGFNPFEEDLFARKYKGVFDHELEFLQKEIILNCDIAQTKYTLRHQLHFSKLMNYLRSTLNEDIDKLYTAQDNFLLEFNRIAHRQFKWQLGYGRESIFRYYQIYSDKALSEIIQKRFQLTPQQLFLIGFLLFSWTGTNFRTALPFKSTAKAITNEMISIFINHFSMTIDEARWQLKENQQINENLFYSYNPLLAKPLLIEKSDFMCPIPIFMFWQITSGIYYSIVNEKNFSEAFGNSFQNFIGEVLKKSCTSANIQIYPEEIFGKEEHRTTDWIIADNNSILFIECKTKRMRLDSKSILGVTQGLEKDLKKMAEFITQVYKTYIDYKNNLYPTLKFDSNKEFYPLVLTLEDWYINFNHVILDMLKSFVIELFNIINLDIMLLESFPYHIRCASEFERDIQLINSIGIKGYFTKVANNTIQEDIKEFEFKNIYEGEYEKVFVEPFIGGDN